MLIGLCHRADNRTTEATEREEVIIALPDTGISTTAIPSGSLLPGHNYVTGTDDTEDRITHEVEGVNRVLMDLTPKPVGTIEWE